MSPVLDNHHQSNTVQEITVKAVAPICSDPLVVVSDTASSRNKELWWQHGHPHSKQYSNSRLTSLAALVRHNAAAHKGEKAFLYPISAEPTTAYEFMTWDEFDRTTEVLALLYAGHLSEELLEANSSQKQPTIALLGGGKTVEYFCTQLALQKLGFRVLLLAESNAMNALHHLLESCNALAMITDSKNSNTDTNRLRRLDMIESLPEAPELWDYPNAVDSVKFQDFDDVWERHAFIIHSSGSTGLPKPIIHTNRSMMLIARMYRLFQNFTIENWFLLFPMYHIAGISIALSSLPHGQILSFPPLSWPPSSSSIFTAWETLASMGHPVDTVHCAPILIENMCEYISDNGGDFTPLSGLKVLQPGGAALSDNLVKTLTSRGVNVKTTYGSTEIGPPLRSIPYSRDNPKCYTFRNLYPDSPHLKMELVGEGTYECVVYKGFELAAELWEGRPADEPYRTNDLFIQDPPGSGNYMLKGRKDDTIVHSNGENTNAGSLQLDIQSDSKLINKALALGHSRSCVGLLVELHPEYSDTKETRDKIWETVQGICLQYPAHSHIMRDMIYILPAGAFLPVTPKGNVKRKEAECLYASVIERLYSDVFRNQDTSSHSTFSSCAGDSETEDKPLLAAYLRSTISSLSGTPEADINDHTTLYDLGIDSRLALSLRSSLSSHLRTPVSLSTLFENPSISKLVSHFESLFNTPATNSPNILSMDDVMTCKIKEEKRKSSNEDKVNEIISRFTNEIQSWPLRSSKAYPEPNGETFLLTGASGSLGNSLLASLSSSPRVSKIYAMVRGPSPFTRLFQALESRGLDPFILAPGGKIEVLDFTMQDPLLGLDIEKYYELANEVTVVVQNAWKMDFNVAVDGFEGDCMRNTVNLLRLTHAGRAKRLAFTSSISTCMGPGHIGDLVEEEPIGSDPSCALATGYAQSKYVVERVLHEYSKMSPSPSSITILRVGQLCGHTVTGHWNQDEMWPIMFATATHEKMKCIPEFLGKMVDWIPVDVAAGTISAVLLLHGHDVSEDTSFADKTIEDRRYQVYNIVNPHPIAWSELIAQFDSALTSSSLPSYARADRDKVTMKTWVERLSALSETHSPDEVPGLRLLGFFEDMAAGDIDGKAEKFLRFKTGKGQQKTESLRQCKPFCEEWMRRSIEVWKTADFM